MKREDVEKLLAFAKSFPSGPPVARVNSADLRALCERWLEVEDAPTGRLDFHCDNEDGVEMCEFSVYKGQRKAKALDGQAVRIIPAARHGRGE